MSNALFSDDKLSISRNICVLHSAFNMLNIIFSAKLFTVHVCASMAKVVCFYFKTISKKHATHMMHTVAILKIVLANVPV